MPTYQVQPSNGSGRFMRVEVDDVEDTVTDLDKGTTEEYVAALKFFQSVEDVDKVKVNNVDRDSAYAMEHSRREVLNQSGEIPDDKGEVVKDHT